MAATDSHPENFAPAARCKVLEESLECWASTSRVTVI
jgi:hypothetical protein